MDEGKEKEKEKDQLQIIMEYLLSLSLKDCSFMLTFRVLSNNDKFEPENGIGHKMTRFKDSTIEYKIRVIDVDIKSIHKIPYYYTQDVEIMNIFNGM
ncbi:hypothetical protein BDR26DRAFT_620152 [Obelidium mucronatum]|nr:hypothetical protein BDR26DRAFT_620152 [Obelidium mucronatum]